jgi:ArsR family transcriptional regulator
MPQAQDRARTAPSDCCPPTGRIRPKATRPFAQLFKALGDPTRLEIVGLLASARGELCVCDIEARFDLSQPTVSHHLRILREAQIVSSERRGTWVYYALEPRARERLRAFDELLGP